MYLLIPIDGPPVLRPGHGHDDAEISDALGGATFATLVLPSARYALCVRDDSGERHLPVNAVATVWASAAACRTVPILGPACVTAAERGDPATAPGGVNETAMSIWAHRECLTEADGPDMEKAGTDVWDAFTGLRTDEELGAVPGWSADVREFVRRVSSMAVPAGYPYPWEMLRHRNRSSTDPAARTFAQLGITVRPYDDASQGGV